MLIPTRSPGVLTLQIDGAVTPAPSPASTRLLGALPTVLGRTSDERQVTLCDTRHTGRRVSGMKRLRKVVEDTVAARYALMGHRYFADGAAAGFTDFSYRTTHLERWAAPGFILGPGQYRNDDNGATVPHAVIVPTPIEVALPRGRLRLEYGWEEVNGLEEAVLRRPLRWSLHLPGPVTVDEVTTAYLWPLQMFLTFACDYSVDVHDLNIVFGRRRAPGADVIQVVRPPTSESSGSPPHDFQMLFTLPDVRDRLEPLLRAWMTLFKPLRSCLDLFFGLVVGPQMYLESRFILIAQALVNRPGFLGGFRSWRFGSHGGHGATQAAVVPRRAEATGGGDGRGDCRP